MWKNFILSFNMKATWHAEFQKCQTKIYSTPNHYYIKLYKYILSIFFRRNKILNFNQPSTTIIITLTVQSWAIHNNCVRSSVTITGRDHLKACVNGSVLGHHEGVGRHQEFRRLVVGIHHCHRDNSVARGRLRDSLLKTIAKLIDINRIHDILNFRDF